MFEPTFGPASSSSTDKPRSCRYPITTSATARSSPGGLGSAASSVKRSTTSEAIARFYVGLGRGRADGGTLARAGKCGTDEVAEEGRGPRRTRLELRMELARDEPRMVGQLDDLDQAAFLERSGDHQASLRERRPIVVVDLVTVPVALVHDRLAVRVMRTSSVDHLDRLRAEPHRAAEILDLLLLGQQIDHRMRGLGIHLGRVGAVEAE